MTPGSLVLAVPGDIDTLTGGYIYEKRLLEELRALGHRVQHIELAASFPDPSVAEQQTAREQLSVVPANQPLIIDGLAFGSIATDVLALIPAPLIALIHHPLAKENGLSPARREHLFRTERDNLTLAKHVLVPSRHTAAILMSDYGVPSDKLTIVRPGTDRPTGNTGTVEPPLILSVGIQAPRKGHDVLLKALALMTDIAWQAVIVGSAHDSEHARELAALKTTLGFGDRVRLAGQVPSDALATYYEQATVFALATRYEGYGIVFDEALSHGLPIVSCATGAVPETVPKDAGILVAPDQPQLFAASLRRVLVDRSKREWMRRAALGAGQLLPSWADAARVASSTVQAVIGDDHGHR